MRISVSWCLLSVSRFWITFITSSTSEFGPLMSSVFAPPTGVTVVRGSLPLPSRAANAVVTAVATSSARPLVNCTD